MTWESKTKIVAGLKAEDPVVVNPQDSLVSGLAVNIVKTTPPGDVQRNPPAMISSIGLHGFDGFSHLPRHSFLQRLCSGI